MIIDDSAGLSVNITFCRFHFFISLSKPFIFINFVPLILKQIKCQTKIQITMRILKIRTLAQRLLTLLTVPTKVTKVNSLIQTKLKNNN
jgi:hypothetical protein